LDFVDIALAVTLLILGWALGLLSGPIAEYFGKRRRRKNLAIVLAPEVTLIRSQAEKGISIHEPRLAEIAKNENKPGFLQTMGVPDPDFPTTLHSTFLDEMALLEANLVSLINDLYVTVNRAQHWKEENLKSESDYGSFVASSSGRDLTSFEVNLLQVKAGMSIHYAKVYLKTLYMIRQLADDTLKELGRIAVYSPDRKTIDTFDEPLKVKLGPLPPAT